MEVEREDWDAASPDQRWERFQRLIKLCKQVHKKNKLLEEDNLTLRDKCKEHFQNAQNMMRYEFKLPDGYDFQKAQVNRCVTAQIDGSNVTFPLGPQ